VAATVAAAAAIVVAYTAVACAMDWGGGRGGNTEGAQKTDFRSNP
jgi:hypothetical protein